MAGIVGKFLNFVGLEEVEEEYEDAPTGGPPADWQEEVPRRRKAGLVSLPPSKGFRVVVMHPRTLEDGQVIADQVKGRRPVIVNMDLADERSSQRLLNFLSGVAYALDGGLRKVGDDIFLITPSNVEVAGDSMEEERSWGNNLTR